MVELIESAAQARQAVAAARDLGKRIGLVPTMGALHAGHARLISQCRAESGLVVVSIFVNPTQFGPGEDFDRYPRSIADDLAHCQSAGADLVFAPDVADDLPTWSGFDLRRGVRALGHPRRHVAAPAIFAGSPPSCSSFSRSFGPTLPSSVKRIISSNS